MNAFNLQDFRANLNALTVGFYYDSKTQTMLQVINVLNEPSESIECNLTRSKDYKVESFRGSKSELLELLDGKEGEIRHELFNSIKSVLELKIPVYLYGSAGAGKNHTVEQIANEMKLDFYFTGKITDEFKICGYGDANGKFVETQFYQAFTKGGLFFFDEMDASNENALIMLNAGLANGYFDFPIVGRVKMHENFRCVAAGNTTGRGATEVYNGRNQLDGACLDRFFALKFEYDKRIELKMANQNTELVDFIHDLREASKKANLPLVCSYRCINMITKLSTFMQLDLALEGAIFKGMEKHDLEMLYNGLKLDNCYKKAVKDLINKL
jgi:hypothetical protein